MIDNTIRAELLQQQDYAFGTRYGGTVPDLRADESEPPGRGSAPSPLQPGVPAAQLAHLDRVLDTFESFVP